MIISALAFTFLNTFVKQLNTFNVYQIVFFRSLGSLFFTVPLLIKLKLAPLGNKRMLLLLRSIVGLISMVFFFKSLKYMPMGTAVSIRYIAPLFAALFAIFLLKEKIKPIQWLFFILAFIGVVILKGFDAEVESIGLLYALISAIFAGFVYISIRKIGSADHPLVVVNFFMVLSTLIAGVLAIGNWRSPSGMEWAIFASLGVFGYFGQYYMTKAMQIGETNQVAPLKYLEVIFTMGIGLLWFQEQYTLWSVLGILCIVLGLTLNVVSKR